MFILFDQGTPVGIRPFLSGHIVETASQLFSLLSGPRSI